MGDTPDKDDDGRQKVIPITQPHKTESYYAGVDDSGTEIGKGRLQLINITAADNNKKINCTYLQRVFLHQVYIMYNGAPFGASVDIVIKDDTNTVVEVFAKDFILYGTGLVKLKSEKIIRIRNTDKINITVNNSKGTGIQDPPADFNAALNLKLFRNQTV